ncbi:hypothetical protein DM01DRAFT_1409068 [Hesseltinella vesiculosa]|uniref:SWI/SNF-like complex subunit BAF250 C-terminal domain-containing protein n=1 Tax=Hesseltinella vesiculosa TaxID=101127 RepID=A0A1X2GCJ7_9FUNG|nr:hypothetical protein DM01DRAFT_1409068 [Hesseltinella vesiculosa]
MLPFQQQQQNSPNSNNANQLNGLRFNGMANGNSFNFNDMVGFDPSLLAQGSMPMMQPPMNSMPMSSPQMRPPFTPQQQQQQPQQPQSPSTPMFSPQQTMMLQNQVLQAQLQQQQQQQGRSLYANPLLLQQQQQQAATMAMNRVKQSPSSSPVIAHPPSNLASPMTSTAVSPQQSPMGVDIARPSTPTAQNFQMQQPGSTHSSPQLHRAQAQTNVVYSNPYQQQLQQMQQTQQASPVSSPFMTGQPHHAASPQMSSPSVLQSSAVDHQKLDTPPAQPSPQHQQQPMQAISQPAQDPSTPQAANGQPSTAVATPPPPTISTPTVQQKDQSEEETADNLVTYVPKTRNIETYGGVDLKYFDKFEIRPMVAQLAELGAVDIHALIMSLKSGLKMEVANALNTLTMVTVHTPLVLAECEDLLDVLLDVLDQDFFGYESLGGPKEADQVKQELKKRRTSLPDDTQVNYATLFDMSLDEMKSLIPMLEDSSSEMWLSLRERCLCILNLLRNFSFIPHNMEYLARHDRFVHTLLALLQYTRGIKEEDWDDTHRREAWFVGVRRMDTLDHRKSALMIFSSIAVYLKIPHIDMARAFVRLIHDFMTHGIDTYYSLLAIETWAKIAVSFENQKTFSALIDSHADEFSWIEDIWAELSAVICKDYFGTDGRVLANITMGQLAALEMVMMSLFEVVMITNDDLDLKEQLLMRDKSIPMTILRLCITLAESGNQHFMVVTRRGMEVIRNLLGNGLASSRRRRSRQHPRSQPPQPHPLPGPSTWVPDAGARKSADPILTSLANKVLDVANLREKTMMALLKPSTDVEVLSDLTELLDLIEKEHSA